MQDKLMRSGNKSEPVECGNVLQNYKQKFVKLFHSEDLFHLLFMGTKKFYVSKQWFTVSENPDSAKKGLRRICKYVLQSSVCQRYLTANLYEYYEVANLYKFIQSHLYNFVHFL